MRQLESRKIYISLFYHRALHSRSSLYRSHPRRFHDNPVVVHGTKPTRKRLASLEIRQNRGTGSQLTSQFDFLRAQSTHTSVPFDQEKRRYTPSACRPRADPHVRVAMETQQNRIHLTRQWVTTNCSDSLTFLRDLSVFKRLSINVPCLKRRKALIVNKIQTSVSPFDKM